MPKNGTLICLRGEQEKFVRNTASEWDLPLSTACRLLIESARQLYLTKQTVPKPEDIISQKRGVAVA